jgi:hypothetical protein
MDLEQLFTDVFDPQPGEIAIVLVDTPQDAFADTPEWRDRRAMAARWHAALAALGRRRGVDVLPLVTFPATGLHNAPLPETGAQAGRPVRLEDLFKQATLALALTQFSPSAPLIEATQAHPRLRAASMPLVSPAMEATALAADYAQVAHSCATLRNLLSGAETARLRFSTGDALLLDLRHRTPHVDDGQLHFDKAPPRLVNLPSGEAFTAVYEGECPGEPSRTAGVLPVEWQGAPARLRIADNRVVAVLGEGAGADDLRAFLAADAARRNIAELGLGCNPRARVTGNVLEDEKAGPHVALGRSDHIGGVTGPAAFTDPRHLWHYDFVFARESRVTLAELTLLAADGAERPVVRDGRYLPDLAIGM